MIDSRQLDAFADDYLSKLGSPVSPRYLAGPGDPRHITHALYAAGWTVHSDPLHPVIRMKSPDLEHELVFKPSPHHYHGWWKVHSTLGPGHWYASFSGDAPVEIIAGLTDALVHPRRPPPRTTSQLSSPIAAGTTRPTSSAATRSCPPTAPPWPSDACRPPWACADGRSKPRGTRDRTAPRDSCGGPPWTPVPPAMCSPPSPLPCPTRPPFCAPASRSTRAPICRWAGNAESAPSSSAHIARASPQPADTGLRPLRSPPARSQFQQQAAQPAAADRHPAPKDSP